MVTEKKKLAIYYLIQVYKNMKSKIKIINPN